MKEEHVRRLREEMPSPEEIRRRYLNGDFQLGVIAKLDRADHLCRMYSAINPAHVDGHTTD
jgi:hypothetical protein